MTYWSSSEAVDVSGMGEGSQRANPNGDVSSSKPFLYRSEVAGRSSFYRQTFATEPVNEPFSLNCVMHFEDVFSYDLHCFLVLSTVQSTHLSLEG